MSSMSGSQAKSAMEAHITGEVAHYKGKIGFQGTFTANDTSPTSFTVHGSRRSSQVRTGEENLPEHVGTEHGRPGRGQVHMGLLETPVAWCDGQEGRGVKPLEAEGGGPRRVRGRGSGVQRVADASAVVRADGDHDGF
jgi:hypothetical protein